MAIGLCAWNLLGAYACIRQLRVTGGAAVLANAYEQSLYAHLPLVYDGLFVGAEISGLVGAGLLLIGRPTARAWFAASLMFVIVQFGQLLGTTDLLAHEGPRATAFPIFVVAMGLFQVWIADRAQRARRFSPEQL